MEVRSALGGILWRIVEKGNEEETKRNTQGWHWRLAAFMGWRGGGLKPATSVRA